MRSTFITGQKSNRPTLVSEMDHENLYTLTVQQPDLTSGKTIAETGIERHEQFVKIQEALNELPLKYQSCDPV